MNETSVAFAKLAGIRKATQSALEELRNKYPRANFPPSDLASYFEGAERQFTILREWMPLLFSDFPIVQ